MLFRSKVHISHAKHLGKPKRVEKSEVSLSWRKGCALD